MALAVRPTFSSVRDLPARVVARATGADVRTAERWRSGVHPQPRYERRLGELDAVLAILGRGMTPRAKRQWLEAPNASLRWRPAADVLAAGDFEAVRDAAEAYADGDVV